MSVDNNEEWKLQHLYYSNASITSVGTQAPFLVLIIVSSGTAPQFAVSSALTGAGIILFALEDEREVAELSFGIPTDNTCICSWSQKNQWGQTGFDTLWCICSFTSPLHTSAGTEAIFLVLVKALCSGTPAVSVWTSLWGAAVVFLAQKCEREDTFLSIGISSKCVEHCQGEDYIWVT